TTKVLDLSAFVGDAKARVGVWPFITTPYPVWLWLRGRTASNVVHDRTVFNGAGSSAVNANWVNTGGIEVTIPRTYLAGLGHGTKLQMEFKAAVSLSKDLKQAISFPVVEYTVDKRPSIDQSTMILDGYSVRANWPRTGLDSVGNTAVRVAAGGTPPYTYTSNNPGIASVNSTTGKVTGDGNGLAIITAEDQSGLTATYSVVVSNVFRLIISNGPLNFGQALAWMSSMSGVPLTIHAENDMLRTYLQPWLLDGRYWCCDPNGIGCAIPYYSTYYLSIGVPGIVCGDILDDNNSWGALCLVRI
ncbi:hypothetical protein J1G35_18610, partial [Pseudomonas sp. SH10-3B]|nr:hypothetical protein [Pseudomonas sp. SH10-3B]